MKEADWNSLLQQDIAADEQLEARSAAMAQFDSVTVSEVGSWLCRDLPRYRDILFSNGTPNLMESYPQGVIVDAGSSCGYALAQLRPILPDATLVANDVRNVTLGRYSDEGVEHSVAQMFDNYGIHFYQGSLRRMPEFLPYGYDYLTSVVAFPDFTTSAPFQADTILQLYRGLNRGGAMQVLYMPTRVQFNQVKGYLRHNRVPFDFVETNGKIRARNALGTDRSILAGTLTIRA